MTDAARRRTLFFFLLAVIVTATIAATLSQLELHPGVPLPGSDGTSGAVPLESAMPVSISVNTFVRAILLIVLALGMLYCGYLMLKGATFRGLLRPILSIIALAVLAPAVLYVLFMLVHIGITPEPVETEFLPPALDVKGPPLGPLPPFLIWLAWIGLGVTVATLGVWLLRWQRQRPYTGDPLVLEAERAMKALSAGMDLKSVIVYCYQQMSLALQKEQGIELEETMTAREFERLLEARGVPHAPVYQLTRLFETARYGHQQPQPGDEQRAFDCLNDIVQYCREGESLQ